MREWGRSLQAAVNNRGEFEGTLRDAKCSRDAEKRRSALIEQQGDILTVSAKFGGQVDEALEEIKRRNGGALPSRLRALVLEGFILGGHKAKFVFFETDDRTRVDIYYGGDDGKADGNNHGHIVIKRGQMHTWLAHGANGSDRLRIV